MDKKTAIIIGVIILVLTSIITPFILKKISNKADDISQGTQIEESNKQDENLISHEDESSSGEVISNEKLQIGSGDESEGQKSTEISGEQKREEQESGETTNEYQATSSQGATNQTAQPTEEKNNVPTNVDEENIEENVQNIEVIEVVQNEVVNQEMQIVPEEQEVEQSNIVVPEGAVGVLKIDKINLCQKVAEGHSLEVLKTDLGHVDETAYYKGNIGILGHNNGNAGYFKRLTELTIDDEIQYITENGIMRYKVSEITEIEETDWSKLSKTEDNRITLITCVRNAPTKRYCVQAVEI